MRHHHLHEWNLSQSEAVATQLRLKDNVRIEDDFGDIKTIAGVDLSFGREDQIGHAVVVVLNFPELQVVEAQYASAPLAMPYIPGLLSFRESPIALLAFEKLTIQPDLLMTDGQGIAHPRGFGIACHLGLLLDIPAIGVAKSFLYGVYDRHKPLAPLTSTPLCNRAGDEIGAVLKTKTNTNPLYISPGHRVSVPSALNIVKECVVAHRLPEPTRNAHNYITAYKKSLEE